MRRRYNRLVAALAPFEAYLRGAPPGLPFAWDSGTLKRGLNFTPQTTIGDIDVLGEMAGGGTYEDLVSGAVELEPRLSANGATWIRIQ